MISLLQHQNEARRVWCHFYSEAKKVIERYQDNMHPYYIDNFEVLECFENHLPTFEDLQELLSSIGWQARWVEGYIPPWKVASLIDHQVLPISCFLRPEHEIFFASEPDFIHDIIGHIPSLFSEEYRKKLKKWSSIAAKIEPTNIDYVSYHMNHMVIESNRMSNYDGQLLFADKSVKTLMSMQPSLSYLIDKIYFWIFEFGIFESKGSRKILGAGLISSIRELEKICKNPPDMTNLSFDTVLESINIADEQDCYYYLIENQIEDLLSTFHRRSLGVRDLYTESSYLSEASR